MKKVVILFAILMSAFVCTSCATLPKTIKDGDTLVIGQIKCNLYGYKDTNGVDMNGEYTAGLTMKVVNTITNKEFIVMPDKDGYFYLKNLKPHSSYAISYVELQKVKNDGNGYHVWVDITPAARKFFIPYEKQVVNIGTTEFYFDGTRNYCNWENVDFDSVNNHFKQIDEESEWLDAHIYIQ